jgi:nicotinamidase-related amidase
MMKKALLIIDIQNDYFKGGSHTLTDADIAGENARFVLNYARTKDIPVVHVQHIAVNPGADFFLPDTHGAAFHASVQPLPGEQVIIKNYPNSFRETNLLKHLQENGITELIICGMQTDVCVDATVRAAKDYNFSTTVIGDACTTRDRELYGETIKAEVVHESYLAGMTALGNFYAKVIPTIELLSKM